MKSFRTFVAFLIFLSSLSVCAQTFQTNGSWNTNADWSPAAVPNGTGTDVTLNANPTINSGNSDLIGNVSASNNVTLTVNSNATLTLGSSALFGVGTKKSMTFNNNGTIQINSGSPDGTLEIWGDLIINQNLTLQVTGNLIVHGNLTMNDNATVQVTGGGTVAVGGNLTGGKNAVFQVFGSGSTINVTGAFGLDKGGSISTATGGSITSGSCTCTSCQAQCGSVMPVTLIDFYSTLGNENIILKWSTASELNFNYFDLQKSNDGAAFKSIAQVKGHGTTNERHDYDFEDNFPFIGKNYYRLTSVDFDDHQETFHVIVQEYKGEKDFQISPNPSDGLSITLTFNFDESHGRLSVYDNMGSMVATFGVSESGAILFESPLKSGIYLAKYTSPAFTKTVRLLVK